MRKQNLMKKIDQAILLCTKEQNESNKPDRYAFFLRVLNKMNDVLREGVPDPETSKRLPGALGRVVLDDDTLLKSEIGQLLIEIANEFDAL